MKKELWKGNEAIAEAAVRAGCDGFSVIRLHLRMKFLNICPCACLR